MHSIRKLSLAKISRVVFNTRLFSADTTHDDIEDNQRGKPDQEMQNWIASIILQNHLLPSHATFDNKRHLSMRAKYADMTQMIKFFSSVIDETQEENESKHVVAPKIKAMKKVCKHGVKKHSSDQTFNLGLGPTPALSTRISKDAVKRNKQKDNESRLHGSRRPPPPLKLNASRRSSSRSEAHGKSPNAKGLSHNDFVVAR